MRLSLAMIVKNEEEKLARCLSSVKEYVDELVVVDTGSTDRTKEIAASFGAKLFDFAWCDDFAKARNFSVEKTSGDLVLALDADSFLMKFDKAAVLAAMAGKKAVGLAEITNLYTHNGVKVTDRFLAGAVFPREARYVGPIHEQIEPKLPRVVLPISIFHDGYDNRGEAKFKRNIDILQQALQGKKDAYLLYKLAQEYRGLAQLELADSQFAAAYQMTSKGESYYARLVVEYLSNLVQMKKYTKALEIAHQEQARFPDYPELFFVSGEMYMEVVLSNPQAYIQYFPRIKECYDRCIAIGENPKYQGIVGMGSFMALHNLGAFYEVTGDAQNAKKCYTAAAGMGYPPSQKRLAELGAKR